MNWQIIHTLNYIQKHGALSAVQHVYGDAIKITFNDGPDELTVISASYEITIDLAKKYHGEYPDIAFLCGYRKECIWTGDAINYLENNQIGWGSAGTLNSAISKNDLRTAAHKDFFFSFRLITQMRCITNIVREFDRVFTIKLADGRQLRIGMIKEYEPTADVVRTFWDKFGPIDILWNINPNGGPTPNAIEAGEQLGCEVMKWIEVRSLIQNR